MFAKADKSLDLAFGIQKLRIKCKNLWKEYCALTDLRAIKTNSCKQYQPTITVINCTNQLKFKMDINIKTIYLFFILSLVLACSKSSDDSDSNNGNTPDLSSSKTIISFTLLTNSNFCEREVSNSIKQDDGIIEILVSNSLNVRSIDPTIVLSEGATISPKGAQDFSSPVTYKVTAENGSTKDYDVIVTIGPTEKEILTKLYELNPGNTTGWNLDDANIANWKGIKTDSNGKVVYISLFENGVTKFPSEFSQLCFLTELIVDRNDLAVVPDVIFELESLKFLELVITGISEIPSEIGNLKNLRILGLGYNQIKTLPEELGNLENLTYLDLSNNQIEVIPTEIGMLKNLRFLHLSNNNITKFPVEIGQLENLEQLSAIDNKLTFLPSTIGQLGKLSDLDLTSNQITSLPESIGNLESLKTLQLQRNQIENLPIDIGNLQNLKTLRLYVNNLSTIPTEIGNLRQLSELAISGNNLNSLPVEISQLFNLKNLSIYSNPLIAVPIEICDMEFNYGTYIIKDDEVTCE